MAGTRAPAGTRTSAGTAASAGAAASAGTRTSAAGACIGVDPEDQRASFTAQLIWQQLHGIVSLRISRPRFPWPPLAETVTEAVDRLLAGARSAT